MQFAFTEEQDQLRGFVRQFLEEKSSEATVRELMETESGYEEDDENEWLPDPLSATCPLAVVSRKRAARNQFRAGELELIQTRRNCSRFPWGLKKEYSELVTRTEALGGPMFTPYIFATDMEREMENGNGDSPFDELVKGMAYVTKMDAIANGR